MAKPEQSFWRRELTPRKIIFYSLWHGLHIGLFALGWYPVPFLDLSDLTQDQPANKPRWKQETDSRLSGLNVLTFSVWISRGAGLNLSVDAAIILFPMCRNILRWLRPKLKFLPLDEAQWFHRQVAYSLLFWTIVHTSAHYVNFFNIEMTQIRRQAAVQIHYTEAGGITGHVMLLCMLLMYTTAHAKIRQQSYETFWYTHHLFIPFFLALYTHATGCFVRDSAQPYSPFAGKPFWDHCLGYEGWRWELWGGGIYLIERIYREIRSRRETEILKVIHHPYQAVEIQFRKPSMRYKPGQYLYLNVPSVSLTQWHPFTITSCPFDPYVSIHVRQVGDFTRDLADALGCGESQSKLYDELDPMGMYEIALTNGQSMPKIRIDGPYGAPAEDVLNNEIAVLIGTGIGITPFAGILKNLWHLRSQAGASLRLRRVELIWVCRNTNSFEWFQSLLASLEQQSQQAAYIASLYGPGAPGAPPGTSSQEFLRIHTYLTQRLDADTAANIVLNSVGSTKDPLTELSAGTNFGRPDFARLFEAMAGGLADQRYFRGLAAQKSTVGVYFCGPNPAAREIKAACKKANTPTVRFKFWKEHF